MSKIKLTEQSDKNLGFGEQVIQRSRKRLINKNGTFNVTRKGYSFFRSRSFYHNAITCSWPKFIILLSVVYFLINLLFGLAYYLLEDNSFDGITAVGFRKFLECFFFSVQTIATIGYGKISPASVTANILVTIESIMALLLYAVSSGLVFARFSSPNAKIKFSENALIAPYKDIKGLMFRVVNERQNQILNLEARVLLIWSEQDSTGNKRKFHELKLELSKVLFFPLHWTIVHPIDDDSPLKGLDEESIKNKDYEIVVLLSGLDDTFSQTINSFTSYKLNEVVWNAKFNDILDLDTYGNISIDLNRINEFSLQEATIS